MGKKKPSRIQQDVDQTVKHIKHDMAEVVVEEPQHGKPITFYHGEDGNVWGYDDGYKKKVDRK